MEVELLKILTKEDCEKVLARSASVPVQILNYHITKFSEDVVGYMGDHFRLIITFCEKNNPKNVHRSSFFIKSTPIFNQNQIDYVNDIGIFEKEVLLYRNILSDLLKIYPFGPRCYFIKPNCIVLEDLSVRHFQLHSNINSFDYNHCISLLKTLAGFHASSLIYEQENGFRLDEKFQDELKEGSFSFVEGHPRQKWCVTVTDCLRQIIKLIHNDNGETGNKLHKFVFEELPKLLKPSPKFRNVLTHDDLWCNNMMFNDKMECVFIDFQMARYSPPAFDFLVAMRLNIDSNFLEGHLRELGRLYYGFLDAELKKHNLHSDSLLSETEFAESLQFYQLPALIEAAMYGTHIYISTEMANRIVADIEIYNEFCFLNRGKFVIPEFQNNETYRNRLKSIIQPLITTLNEQCPL